MRRLPAVNQQPHIKRQLIIKEQRHEGKAACTRIDPRALFDAGAGD
jgi:hypothetical protein